MSVEISVLGKTAGFWNFQSDQSNSIFAQQVTDSLSNNSRIGIEFKEFDAKFILYGRFKDIAPNINIPDIERTNSNSLVDRTEVYFGGELEEVTRYLTPQTVGAISNENRFPEVFAGHDVIYAPLILEREGGLSFNGYGGNDRFYAYGSHEHDDIFYGGDGVDSLIYSGPRANYSITASNTIWNPITEKTDSVGFFIRDNTGRDGVLQISEVERVVFSDTAIGFDIDGVAGQAYRIYKAAFDRAPDLAGLGYWINAMDNGAALTGVAGGFIASTEFQSRYGNVNDTDFIRLLYENVLDRQPDAAGYAFWQDAMGRGLTREALLAEFSESPENKSNVAGLIANGIEYTPFIS
jgi:hypothetical protein